MAWVADFFRLLGGFLYWNAVKSRHRLRGARGHCPCQHPSDSGRAWETDCNAIIHWRQPRRFRRICPLLVKTPEGRWRCSVDRTHVRPFWGRALGFYGGSLVILYLAGTLAAFAFLRTAGYGVTYAGVVWPPAWKQFHVVKSAFFYDRFRRAYAVRDIREAMIDLSLAYDFNPQNYDAGLELARLCQAGHPSLSNGIYERLLAQHPARAGETARAFFRALLARGDFAAVQKLALCRILASPDDSPAWLNAFLFACSRTGDTDAIDTLTGDTRAERLPPDVRAVLMLADELLTAAPANARQLLLSGVGQGASGYTLYFACRQLIDRGFSPAALGLIDRPDTDLNPHDRVSLRLDALAVGGWSAALDKEAGSLLAPPPTPAVVQLLGTHLIRHPDANLLGRLRARLEQSPLPTDSESYSAYLVFFCAAGVLHDEASLAWSVDRMKAILGARFDGLDAARRFFLERRKTGHLENILPALQPLPLETTYALLACYIPAAPAPGTPK